MQQASGQQGSIRQADSLPMGEYYQYYPVLSAIIQYDQYYSVLSSIIQYDQYYPVLPTAFRT